jgi:hypothetical protein
LIRCGHPGRDTVAVLEDKSSHGQKLQFNIGMLEAKQNAADRSHLHDPVDGPI